MAEVCLPGTTLLALDGPSGPYQLFVFVPEVPPPPGGFPVVFLLDGNNCFGMAVDLVRQGQFRPTVSRLVPAIVVGIAYPGDQPLHQARRRTDFGPARPGEPASQGAGRDAFAHFLGSAVRPLLRARFPADPRREVIAGHSLGGFFALDALAQDPSDFAGVLAMSPSVWWNRERLLAGLRSGRGAGSSPRVWIGVGEWEEALAPWEAALPDSETTAQRRRERAMVGNARAMAEAVADRFGPTALVGFECLAGETHVSVIPVALSHGLRALLGPGGLPAVG
ncbi:alpha/beta hydrolase [Roseomonas sp. BN140053]|uniref:alpha/beta hydrolase n=1 Tax=Roseomonas sp. BN140053 TaxID=3391898 RepID=UPI0039E8AE80